MALTLDELEEDLRKMREKMTPEEWEVFCKAWGNFNGFEASTPIQED